MKTGSTSKPINGDEEGRKCYIGTFAWMICSSEFFIVKGNDKSLVYSDIPGGWQTAHIARVFDSFIVSLLMYRNVQF